MRIARCCGTTRRPYCVVFRRCKRPLTLLGTEKGARARLIHLHLPLPLAAVELNMASLFPRFATFW